MTRVSLMAVIALAGALSGCGEFETRSIVLDLRILGMSVTPPEIVMPIDPENPPQGPGDLELPDVEVCALVADPADSRALHFELTACALTDTLRCDDPMRPVVQIASGMVDDPEEAGEPVRMCGTLTGSVQLYAVLQDALENDSLSGFGGIEVIIGLATYPEGGSLETAEYAGKRMIYSPELPPGRVANGNPSLDALMVTGPDGESEAPFGRCGDVTPMTLGPGESLTFEPVESEGAREDYVVPTFDGGVRMFKENLTYAWYATAGSWQREGTGGPKDLAGNEPPLDSEWTAPPAEVVGGGLDVRFWVVQRDERGGLSWYETCARVLP